MRVEQHRTAQHTPGMVSIGQSRAEHQTPFLLTRLTCQERSQRLRTPSTWTRNGLPMMKTPDATRTRARSARTGLLGAMAARGVPPAAPRRVFVFVELASWFTFEWYSRTCTTHILYKYTYCINSPLVGSRIAWSHFIHSEKCTCTDSCCTDRSRAPYLRSRS